MPLEQRILIVRLGAIGDVTNALVVANALRAANPDAHIGWAVHELSAPLVQGHPAVTRVHLWRKRDGLGGISRLLRELRAEEYELAIDLQRLAKSALVARRSGARRVLGYDRARTKEQSWLLLKERIAPGDPGAPMTDQYMDVVRHLGLSGPPVHSLPEAPEAESKVAVWLDEFGAPPVLVNLGASKPPNRWAPERFGRLGRRIAEELGLAAVFTGAPDERELAAAARAAAGDGPGVFDLVGATSLPEFWTLARRSRLFVGCDTGPMHLAAAVGTKVVALFGPADERRTGPYGPGHRVVRAELRQCVACERGRRRSPHHRCMEDLTLEHVFRAVEEELAR